MLVVDGSVFSQYSSVRTPPTLSLVNYFGGNSGLVKSTTIKGCFWSLRANVRSGLSRSILLACSWAGLMSHANSQNQLLLNAHFQRADSALAVSRWVAAKRSGCEGSRTIGIGGSTKREWGVDRELDVGFGAVVNDCLEGILRILGGPQIHSCVSAQNGNGQSCHNRSPQGGRTVAIQNTSNAFPTCTFPTVEICNGRAWIGGGNGHWHGFFDMLGGS